MPEENNQNERVTVQPLEEISPIHEVVSPVQPKKPHDFWQWVNVLLLFVFIFVFAYSLRSNGFNLFRGTIKEAQAPETPSAGLSLPEVVPQISSTSTSNVVVAPSSPQELNPTVKDTPVPEKVTVGSGAPPMPQVAATNSTKVLQKKTFVSPLGFSVSLPAHTVMLQTDLQVSFTQNGKLVATVTAYNLIFTDFTSVGEQLVASSSITNLSPTTFLGLPAYTYQISQNGKGLAVLKDQTIYYVSDYSGGLVLKSFVLN